MAYPNAHQLIRTAVLAWKGINPAPHRFGGEEYLLGTREIGHVHGDHLVDIPFPKRIRDEVIAAGDALPHHVLPDSGWISRPLHSEEDVFTAIRLLERSYTLATQQKAARQTTNVVGEA